MDEHTLRLWVRGRLDPARRRQVTRWMVQCTDPRLPVLLRGLAREQADARADDAERARGGVWSALVQAFHDLVDANAAWLVGPGERIVLAGAEAAQPPLDLREDGERVSVRARTPSAQEGALYLTEDGAPVRRLHGPSAQPPGPLSVAPGARSTVWMVWGPQLPRSSDPVEELAAALADPTVEQVACR